MEKYVCVHGHFYQPPRENPWLENIELQDSAAPFHDWNERIAAECYGPNATARILDGEGRISEIVNNYAQISFNMGPTVLAWMKDQLPEVHEAIVRADQLSRERFSGHGSALAQVYNHMILPLANERDRYTQVLWGIRDFEHRFGRKPEGMWLPETAADTPTFQTLAQLGIKFTILSPFQASRVRAIGKRSWQDVNGGQVDPTRPYLVRLPGKQSIVVFFYDAPVSQAVAFERLLENGQRFADRLMSAFNDQRNWDQLVHIATDGESYGHHHRKGEMALAYALRWIEEQKLARLTNYAEFLQLHPPTHEAQIHEKSAWSCVHGVGRWMRNCGCNSGGHGGWTQEWREPLRNSLDWLRDAIAPLYQSGAGELLKNPDDARNDYISVILDRSPENREQFFSRHAKRELTSEDKVRVLKLLEVERHAMLMYTSCGWFFDELSGIETVQVIQYAARAIQLVQELFGQDLEPEFLNRLQHAKSNIPENGDGRQIYEKFVKPAMIDWDKTAAHYAISSVFQEYSGRNRIFSFSVEDENRHTASSGKTRLVLGRAHITSEITSESEARAYAILYLGEHNLTGAVRPLASDEEFEKMRQDITQAYESADFPETIRRIDRHFGTLAYSLKSLFKDEQRRIINEILASTREDLVSRCRLIVERYEPLMIFLEGSNVPLPTALNMAAEVVQHSELGETLTSDPIDFERLERALRSALRRPRKVLDSEISFAVKTRLETLLDRLQQNPGDTDAMQTATRLAEFMLPLPMEISKWRVQNTYWEMLRTTLPSFRERAEAGDDAARAWVSAFLDLGERLHFAVNHLRPKSVQLIAA